MHELSIVQELVDLVLEALRTENGGRVIAVHLRVGALAGIVGDSLVFCYEFVTRETPLEGSQLIIQELPVVIHCQSCNAPVELPGLQSFRCPRCETPGSNVLQGKELEIVSIELLEDPTPATAKRRPNHDPQDC